MQFKEITFLLTTRGLKEQTVKHRKDSWDTEGLGWTAGSLLDAPRCLQLQEDVWEQTQKLSLPDKQDKETQTGSWPVWSRNGLRDDKKFCSVQIAHLVPTKPWGPRKIRHPLFTSPLLKSPFIKTLTFLPQLGDLLRIPLCNGDLTINKGYVNKYTARILLGRTHRIVVLLKVYIMDQWQFMNYVLLVHGEDNLLEIVIDDLLKIKFENKASFALFGVFWCDDFLVHVNSLRKVGDKRTGEHLA
ncbi:uncharacterized protein [Symphalangus syndactylus]|uniref:uncharacterized protein n=1 Tax=Symphalangus syndactylus TaxID=9590 RepID=UPI003006C4D3